MADKIRKLTSEELFTFSDEMAMMISSGVSSVECITLMLEEAGTSQEKALLKKMQDALYETSSLAKCIAASGVFPGYFCNMIEVGEATGKTDEVFKLLARHYQRELAINAAIKNAVSYPLLMVGMMLVIIIVLVTQIMPIFERVFMQLGSTMSGVSGGILAIGNFLSKYGWIFLIVIAALVATVFILRRTPSGREKLLAFVNHFRKIRSVNEKLQISRFSSGMAMTIGSGMDILQAISVASTLATSVTFENKVAKLRESYVESMDLGKAFSEAGIFIGLYGRMATLAARTGNIEDVMDKIATTYQEQADSEISDIISVVEPTLVIIMSLVVGLILLSVMLPLLNIMAGVG